MEEHKSPVDMSDNECPFCELDAQTKRIIRKGDLATSFLSNPRLMKGHVLVVPNRHMDNPTELTDEETIAVFKEVKRIQAKLLSGFAAGVDQWQKTRLNVSDRTNFKVGHVHFHILPSNEGDEIFRQSLTWTVDRFTELTDAECEEMIRLLKD